MPATIQTSVGPVASASYQWASQTNQQIATVLRDFATAEDGLQMDPTSTDKQILDRVNQLAGTRIYNYIVNWHRNKRRREEEAAIELENPLNV